jgi:hypothetical protein
MVLSIKTFSQCYPDFALGERYSNINLLAGDVQGNDPVATWSKQVDQMIFESHVSDARKAKIRQNAQVAD